METVSTGNTPPLSGPMFNTPPTGPDNHRAWAKPIGAALAGTLIIFLILLAFLWPTATSTAQNIPVAVAGPQQAVDSLTSTIDSQSDNAITFVTVDNEKAAITAIKERKVYGALVLTETPTVLTASAASPVVSQMLTQVASQLQTQLLKQAYSRVEESVGAALAAGQTPPELPRVVVRDIVPLSDHDPRGTGLSIASLPLALGGVIGGVIVFFLTRGTARRLIGVTLYAALSGVVLTATLQGWFEVIQGDFWVNTGAIALTLFATGALVVGLGGLLGRPGLALAAIITVLIGNPLASSAAPMQFLVEPWGAIGQGFVPGASATLLRNLSYFPEANSASQWLTLTLWAVSGLILIMLSTLRARTQSA
ncbi:ABC transporter permease [Lysinibacter sp. HNR]|uniref:ABC transporter permease n=1 Tax=Lysinibacter sp. HNR TaxID=3031408 RepID=UPI002435AA3E|nr:ABC transporter permease [Lysinibacter sp. HNR]WGD37893.1 hypothetical protein FrondiHNR_02980 [Lysinibacter sp. HNR]